MGETQNTRQKYSPLFVSLRLGGRKRESRHVLFTNFLVSRRFSSILKGLRWHTHIFTAGKDGIRVGWCIVVIKSRRGERGDEKIQQWNIATATFTRPATDIVGKTMIHRTHDFCCCEMGDTCSLDKFEEPSMGMKRVTSAIAVVVGCWFGVADDGSVQFVSFFFLLCYSILKGC